MPQNLRNSRAGALEGLLRDVRYAGRVLYHKPAFTLIALATLALGIGANTAIFSVVNAALLTPVPVPSPERVVMVWTDRLSHGSTGYPASEPDFIDWQASDIFEKLAGFVTDGYNVLIGNTPVRVLGGAVSKEWFEIAQVKPYLGRLFREQDMRAGHDHAAVLTYDFWNSRFLADPSVVGKTTIINNVPYTVIGVLPKKLHKIANEELYVPLVFGPPYTTDREMRFIGTVGRLAPGVSLAAAQTRIAALNARLALKFPREDGGNRIRLQPIEEAYVEDVHTLVLVLFGAVGFVLLVACANIANLLLVRGAARQKELAIRAALGASRFSLMRQLLTESVLLSVLGGILGIFPALLGIRFLAKYRPEALPNADLIGLNPTVLLFTLLLALCTGVLFGIIPAWNSWRANAASPLRERSQTAGELKFGNLFVVGEVALTVVLAVAAGLMLRSFLHLRASYPGYDTRVLTMRVSLTGKQYDLPQEQIKFCRLLLDRLHNLAGVRGAAAMDVIPTSGDIQGGMLHFTDRPEPGQNNQAVVIIAPVTPDFFGAMHIPLIRGRAFTQADGANDERVIILDEATAKQYWPNQDPIGKTVRVRFATPLRKIVGIVGSIDRSFAVKVKTRIGQVYLPFDQWPTSDISLVISSDVNTASLIPAVRREISALAPDQPVYEIQTMDEARAAGQTSSRFGTWLLGLFALLSLSLAAIGVYGVIAYTVEQRTREIGLRMALGATQHDLLFAVLKKGLALVLLGLAIGFCGALALGKLMHDLLHGISGTDPAAFLGAAVVLLFAGVLATYIPAFRASRIDPMVALRHE
jgi:putative ABC transport system permease protein